MSWDPRIDALAAASNDPTGPLMSRIYDLERRLAAVERASLNRIASAARVIRGAGQSIPTNSNQAIVFTSADLDTGGLWNAGDPTKLTATRAGVYLLEGGVTFTNAAGGIRRARFVVDGVTTYAEETTEANQATSNPAINPVDIVELSLGSHVQIEVFQTSGVTLSTVNLPNLAIAYIGSLP